MENSKLKIFQKYLFEFAVIFMGITLSFMFDEWRNARKEKQERKQLVVSIKNQLNQAKALLIKEDSILKNRMAILEVMIREEDVADSLVIEFFDYACKDFYVNLNGTLNTLRSLTEQGAAVISGNVLINKRIQSINSIAIDHTNLVDDLRSSAKSELRPLLVRYRVIDDLFSNQYDDSTMYQGMYEDLRNNITFRTQQKIWYMKWENLSSIHETLVRFLGEIENELKAIE
jgi:hypothetical protein